MFHIFNHKSNIIFLNIFFPCATFEYYSTSTCSKEMAQVRMPIGMTEKHLPPCSNHQFY